MATLTVFLYGGLGNQLFQYAAGRALTLRRSADLILDTAGFDFDLQYRRKFELDRLSITPHLRRSNSMLRFRIARVARRLSEPSPSLGRLVMPWLFVETSKTFDASIVESEVLGHRSMMGYWQDERYFIDARATIVRELQPKSSLSPGNQGVAARIQSAGCPVAIHLRRLHEVAAGKAESAAERARRESSGILLPLAYYEGAIGVISRALVAPTFFVFSDDPTWARENLKMPNDSHFLERGRGPDYEDIFLMSLCRHHVIANSSFSWWGAWLADRSNQIVIAPKESKHTPNIPSRWHELSLG